MCCSAVVARCSVQAAAHPHTFDTASTRAQTRGVTIVRATLAIPHVFRLVNVVYPLFSLYFHLVDLLELADDLDSAGAKSKAFRHRMSVERTKFGRSNSGKEDAGHEAVRDQLSSSSDGPQAFISSVGVQSASLSLPSERVSEMSASRKLAGAIAVTILSCFIFALNGYSVYRNATTVCDSTDDVLRRCVLISNTLSPFGDTSQCKCLAYHGNCESNDVYNGSGAIADSSEAMERLR